jgi:surface antigen
MSLLFVILLLAACAPTTGPRESTGTLLGAGAGALIGSQFGSGEGRLVGAAIGTLAGALIGQDIGRSLDRVDRQYMEKTTQRSLESSPSNQASSWVNPDSGNNGAVTPIRTFKNQDGRYCREYQQVVRVGGDEQQAYGTACRQSDGSWKISNAEPASQNVQLQPRTRIYVREPVYPPYYWPFFTTLSFSFGDHGHHGYWGRHSGWGHRGRWGHHGPWGWDD